jgi:hypothetical protein
VQIVNVHARTADLRVAGMMCRIKLNIHGPFARGNREY